MFLQVSEAAARSSATPMRNMGSNFFSKGSSLRVRESRRLFTGLCVKLFCRLSRLSHRNCRHTVQQSRKRLAGCSSTIRAGPITTAFFGLNVSL
jgi:hypothetical protein